MGKFLGKVRVISANLNTKLVKNWSDLKEINELVQLIPSLAVSNPLGGNFSKIRYSTGHGNLQENQAKLCNLVYK